MSCNTHLTLSRFLVLLGGPEEKSKIYVKDVYSISGLGMGDQGTVTLTQQDKTVELPDGIRKFDPLTIAFRFNEKDKSSFSFKERLFKWYNERSTRTYDLDIFITNRNFNIRYAYRYIGSSIKSLKENDKELGRSEIPVTTATFLPYDVIALIDKKEAETAWSPPSL
jgi:hypothetical protein